MQQRLFAVYGTLKQGYGNQVYLKNAKFLGEHITEPAYSMYSLGAFPAVTTTGTTPIHTEIYAVTDENTVSSLYRLEGYTGIKDNNRNYYDLITIDTPYGKADMFVMKQLFNKQKIETGKW